MKRLVGALALVAALVVPLAACTASPSAPTDDAVAKWIIQQTAAKLGGGAPAIGVAGSISDASTSDVTGEGVTMGLDASPFTITGFDVRCDGAPTLSVRLTIDAATGSLSEITAPVRCDRSPHTIPLDATDVARVTVNGEKTSSQTGWFVTVFGSPTPESAQRAGWAEPSVRRREGHAAPAALMAGLLDAVPGPPGPSSSLRKDFSPVVSVRGVQVTCSGAPTMRIHLVLFGATVNRSAPVGKMTSPVVCDRKLHTVDVDADDIAAIAVTGTSVSAETSYLVSVQGSAS